MQVLDWDRRHRHMRLHTALHLLTAVIPYPVTGGQITASHGRLDFDMPDMTQDRAAIETALNDYVARDVRVSDGWITAQELDANPDLVRTMAVQPPRGAGKIRLVRVGDADDPIDLQPCGGTHVARTGEIGALRLGRIERRAARTGGSICTWKAEAEDMGRQRPIFPLAPRVPPTLNRPSRRGGRVVEGARLESV